MSDMTEEIVDAYGGLSYEDSHALAETRNDDYLVVGGVAPVSVRPSVKYGLKLELGVFIGIVVLSFFAVALCMYMNKKQEERKRSDALAKKESDITKLQNILPSKPWSGANSSDVTTDRTISMPADCSFDDFSTDSSAESPEQVTDVFVDEVSRYASLPDAPEVSKALEMPPKKAFGKDGSTCPLCSEPFSDGEEVVESNNPLCNHCHHKTCINRWLQFQNTCPVCNQPYALQSV